MGLGILDLFVLLRAEGEEIKEKNIKISERRFFVDYITSIYGFGNHLRQWKPG